LLVPAETAALLKNLSEVVDMPPEDLVVAMVYELAEQVAKNVRKHKSMAGPITSALLELPAFRDALELTRVTKLKRTAKAAKRPTR
jgi:hypothetical protein